MINDFYNRATTDGEFFELISTPFNNGEETKSIIDLIISHDKKTIGKNFIKYESLAIEEMVTEENKVVCNYGVFYIFNFDYDNKNIPINNMETNGSFLRSFVVDDLINKHKFNVGEINPFEKNHFILIDTDTIKNLNLEYDSIGIAGCFFKKESFIQ